MDWRPGRGGAFARVLGEEERLSTCNLNAHDSDDKSGLRRVREFAELRQCCAHMQQKLDFTIIRKLLYPKMEVCQSHGRSVRLFGLSGFSRLLSSSMHSHASSLLPASCFLLLPSTDYSYVLIVASDRPSTYFPPAFVVILLYCCRHLSFAFDLRRQECARHSQSLARTQRCGRSATASNRFATMIRRCSGSVLTMASRYCNSVDRNGCRTFALVSRTLSSQAGVAARTDNNNCSRSFKDTVAASKLNFSRPISWQPTRMIGGHDTYALSRIQCMNSIHVQRSGLFIRQYSSGKDKEPQSRSSGDGGGGETATAAASSASKLTSAIKERIPEWHVSDAVSVYSITILFLAVLLTPIVIDQMKKSDNMYEEIEVDDAVRHVVEEVSRDIEGTDIDKAFGIEREPRSLSDEEDDSKAVGNTIDVVSDVLNSEALQSAIASLVTRVVQSSQFQKACQTLLKNLWDDLVNDPETTAQVVQLLNNAIQNEEIKRSVRELVLQLIQDEEVYREFTNLVVRLGEDQEVLTATQALLTESAHKALNDPEILDHSMEFATDVVGDDIVQRSSGEALRNTVSYAVQPGLSTVLAFAGIALVFVSVSALSNARSSTKEDEMIDSALASPALHELGDRFLDRATKLVTMPGTIVLSTAKTAATVALLPFKAVGNAFSSIVRRGKSASSAVINLPATSLHRLVEYISLYTKPLLATYERTGDAISTSFVGSTFLSLNSGTIELSKLCSKVYANLCEVPRWTEKVEKSIERLSTVCLTALSRCMAGVKRSSRVAVVVSHDASKRIGERLITIAGAIVLKTGAWSSWAIQSVATCLSWLRGLVWKSRRGGHV